MQLRDIAEAWIVADPDPQTRFELEQLLGVVGGAGESAGELADELAGELERRFGSTLTFGTAGLRGPLGAGQNRMNRVVVRQTTAAMVDYLGELAEAEASGATSESASNKSVKGNAANSESADCKTPKIIIGYDGRKNSDVFARDAAAVATARGAEAILLEGVVPTPVLAHAVLRHGCDAGIMITASHNPPQDNGYKVYWSDGAQVISPHDAKIEYARSQLDLLPRDYAAVSSEASLGKVISASDEIELYVQATATQISSLFENSQRQQSASEPAQSVSQKVVYTPLHGVGKQSLLRLFDTLGLPEPIVVAEQAEPDGNFPTVKFPNPEESGALDLALKLATEVDADVILANDPDGDRLCVALRADGDSAFRVLTGDELGCLLADGILSLLDNSESMDNSKSKSELLVGTTIVSSQLLAKIAKAHGAQYAETLTGFKWLARSGDDRPEKFVFGYEEALGFSVLPQLVRDKDAIAAAAVFMLLLEHWQPSGPLERLSELYQQHGLHKSRQVSFRYEDASTQVASIQAATIMGSLRMSPPESLDIKTAVDFAEGTVGNIPANVLLYQLHSGARVIIRPSGTEPKLKAYLEVLVPEVQEMSQADQQAVAQLDKLEADVRTIISG